MRVTSVSLKSSACERDWVVAALWLQQQWRLHLEEDMKAKARVSLNDGSDARHREIPRFPIGSVLSNKRTVLSKFTCHKRTRQNHVKKRADDRIRFGTLPVP